MIRMQTVVTMEEGKKKKKDIAPGPRPFSSEPQNRHL